MRLVGTYQVDWADAHAVEYDLIVTASGFERRATHVAQSLPVNRAPQRVALAFQDRQVESRRENDKYFSKHGFELRPAAGDDDRAIRDLITERVSQLRDRKRVRILIDYTSMTRVWYASVLYTCRQLENTCEYLDVTFTYAPSRFSEPKATMPNEHVGPVKGFSSLNLPNRRTALVIGLGYERGRALGLSEYVEAGETYVFLANPGFDERFVTVVRRNNEQLLRDLGKERVFSYPLADLQSTAAKLTSLVHGLYVRGYRVILAPLGPKPFGFLCFLVATRLTDLDVWRVSPGAGGSTYDRHPLGPVIACTAQFVASSEAAHHDRQMFWSDRNEGQLTGDELANA